jgi:hypothetical protein
VRLPTIKLFVKDSRNSASELRAEVDEGLTPPNPTKTPFKSNTGRTSLILQALKVGPEKANPRRRLD